jgi:hypothetical protein
MAEPREGARRVAESARADAGDNAGMDQPLAFDTPLEIERRQIDAWRRMSPAQKAEIVAGLTTSAYAMTFAGVRHRHPDASPREIFLRAAIVTLGPALAEAAYPDAATLLSAP